MDAEREVRRARWSRRLWIIYALAMTAGCFIWSTAWEAARTERDAWAARAAAAEAALAGRNSAPEVVNPTQPKAYRF